MPVLHPVDPELPGGDHYRLRLSGFLPRRCCSSTFCRRGKQPLAQAQITAQAWCGGAGAGTGKPPARPITPSQQQLATCRCNAKRSPAGRRVDLAYLAMLLPAQHQLDTIVLDLQGQSCRLDRRRANCRDPLVAQPWGQYAPRTSGGDARGRRCCRRPTAGLVYLANHCTTYPGSERLRQRWLRRP